VDDLLERAGCRNVIHLHGFLPELRCTACGHLWNIGYTEWPAGSQCPSAGCGSIRGVKPNIVFFGEMAPRYADLWEAFESTASDDVMIVIGTSGVVLPVNAMASAFNGFSILNNLEAEPAIDDSLFARTFYLPATQAAPQIGEVLRERLG